MRRPLAQLPRAGPRRAVCVVGLVAASLWLTGLARFLRSPPATCLALPPLKSPRPNASGAGAPAASVDGVLDPSFVLLWSTNASSFTLRPRRCIESIFYHHPRAAVRVFSNGLPLDFFAEFRARGYAVRVHRYSLADLLGGTPAAPWLLRLGEWERGPYFYSHVTDAVRVALLFRDGGIYLDTDVILTRPMRLGAPAGLASHVGALADRGGGIRLGFPGTLGVESYEGGGAILNGAILAFASPGSRFLWNCLHEFATDYKADRWGWNGPELLTRVQARCAGAADAAVQMVPPEAFYPLHWNDVAQHADGRHPEADAKLWSTITHRSFAVHVWNKKTASLTFAPTSLLHRVLNTWTVLPAPGRDRELSVS